MKKIIAAILIIILALSGCSTQQKTGTSNPQQSQEVTKPPVETATQEVAPTEEPTAALEPAPTPDTDPVSKLMVSNEEFIELLNLWPASSSPISKHGAITRFSINSQYGIDTSSLNFIFAPEKSESELFSFYQELIVGEWEDSEYSAGPSVYGGLMEDKIETTCQVATIDGKSEVFMGMFIDSGSAELDALFDTHWPIGLLEMNNKLSDNALFFKYFEYRPGASVSFSKSWDTEGEEAVSEVLAYYNELLSSKEGYKYFEGGEYEGAFVSCNISGIEVIVAQSMDTRIEISLLTKIE